VTDCGKTHPTPQAQASAPFSSTEIPSLIQTRGRQGRNLDRTLQTTVSLVSFEQDPTLLASVGLAGAGRAAGDRTARASLGHSYFPAVALRSSTIPLPGSEQSLKAPLLPALGSS